MILSTLTLQPVFCSLLCSLFYSQNCYPLSAVGLFFNDLELIKKQIEKATDMLNEGGDWERRNRLKVR